MKLFCPRCGSGNVRSGDLEFFRMDSDTQRIYCKDCGYVGPLVIGKDGAVNRHMQDDLKKHSKKEPATGVDPDSHGRRWFKRNHDIIALLIILAMIALPLIGYLVLR